MSSCAPTWEDFAYFFGMWKWDGMLRDLMVMWQAFGWVFYLPWADDLHGNAFADHCGANYFAEMALWNHGVIALVFAAAGRSFQLCSWHSRRHSMCTGGFQTSLQGLAFVGFSLRSITCFSS